MRWSQYTSSGTSVICKTPKTTASIPFIAAGVILKFLFDGNFRGFQSVLWRFVFQLS
jgi:hypothetical protein